MEYVYCEMNGMIKYNLLKTHLLLFLPLLVSCSVGRNAAYTPERKYPAAKLKEDYRVMRDILEHSHPSLYWYNDKKTIDDVFDSGFTAIGDSMNEIQFRNHLSYVLAHIGCGHTSVKFSKNYNKAVELNKQKRFPLLLKVLDDSTLSIIVNLNRQDSVLTRGKIIASIDGVSSKELIDTLTKFISTDGNSVNFRYQSLTNSFPYYYGNIMGLKDTFSIGYIDNTGQVSMVKRGIYDPEADTLRRKDSSNRGLERLPRGFRGNNSRQFIVDSAKRFAVLYVSSFSDGLKKGFFRRSFRTIHKEKVPVLILDIRNNGGGLISHSLQLARYIKQKPFSFMDSVYAIRKKLYDRKYIHSGLVYGLGLTFFTHKANDDKYFFSFFRSKTYEPKKRNHFNGKVYLITGGYTFSAASLLAANLKGDKNVTIVGEETGGAYYGNNGVFIPDMILPNTKLRIRLPLFRIVNNPSFPKDGKGVLPDVEVKASSDTILKGIDPKIEKVLEMIREDH